MKGHNKTFGRHVALCLSSGKGRDGVVGNASLNLKGGFGLQAYGSVQEKQKQLIPRIYLVEVR